MGVDVGACAQYFVCAYSTAFLVTDECIPRYEVDGKTLPNVFGETYKIPGEETGCPFCGYDDDDENSFNCSTVPF